MNPVIVIPTFVSARRRKDGGSILTTYDHMTPISQPGEARPVPQLAAEGARHRPDSRAGCQRAHHREPSGGKSAGHGVPVPRTQRRGGGRAGWPSSSSAWSSWVWASWQRKWACPGTEPFATWGCWSSRRTRSASTRWCSWTTTKWWTTPTSCSAPCTGWENSPKRASLSWPRPATTSIPTDRTCRKARTGGTTISGSRARRSTSGSRRPCTAHACPVQTMCAAAAWLLHKEAFRRVSFDPWIPRGEDLD